METRFNLALQELEDMFGNLDKEVITSVLLAYEGNYDAAVEALLKMSEEPREKSSLDFDTPDSLPAPIQNEPLLQDNFLSLDEDNPLDIPQDNLSPEIYDAILAELMQSHYLSKAQENSQEELQDQELQLAIQQSLSDMKTQPKSKKAFMQKLKDIFRRKKKIKEVPQEKSNKQDRKPSKDSSTHSFSESTPSVPATLKFPEESKQEEEVEELDADEEEVISFVHSKGRPEGQVLLSPLEEESILTFTRPKNPK